MRFVFFTMAHRHCFCIYCTKTSKFWHFVELLNSEGGTKWIIIATLTILFMELHWNLPSSPSDVSRFYPWNQRLTWAQADYSSSRHGSRMLEWYGSQDYPKQDLLHFRAWKESQRELNCVSRSPSRDEIDRVETNPPSKYPSTPMAIFYLAATSSQ